MLRLSGILHIHPISTGNCGFHGPCTTTSEVEISSLPWGEMSSNVSLMIGRRPSSVSSPSTSACSHSFTFTSMVWLALLSQAAEDISACSTYCVGGMRHREYRDSLRSSSSLDAGVAPSSQSAGGTSLNLKFGVTRSASERTTGAVQNQLTVSQSS